MLLVDGGGKARGVVVSGGINPGGKREGEREREKERERERESRSMCGPSV